MWKYWIMAILMTAIFSTLARAEPVFDVTPCPCAFISGIELTGKPWNVENLPNGLELYMVDLDGDREADVEFWVPIGDYNRYPLMYWVRVEFLEYTIQDQARDGSCDDMLITWITFDLHIKGRA